MTNADGINSTSNTTKPILQPRTAFSYRPPHRKIVTGKATLMPGQVRRDLIQVRPPTKWGKGEKGE